MEFWTCLFSLISTWLLMIFTLRLIPTRKRLNLPPGPKPFPIIGNLLDLGDKPHRSLTNLAMCYGPIMSLKLGQITTIVISSAAMAKEVLQTHDQFLSSRPIPDAVTANDHHNFSLAWLPVSSTLWKKLRRICNNRLFSTKILDSSENLRRRKMEELVDDVRNIAVKGDTLDVGGLVFVTLLNLLSNTILSLDLVELNSEMGKEFRVAVQELMVECGKPNIGDYFPILKKMDVQGIRKRATTHSDKLFHLVEQMINQRLQLQKSPDFTPKNDFLHQLLNVDEDNKDFKLDKNEIKHFLLILFVAGTDTTVAAIQWIMAHLLRNQEIMSKAKAELKKVIGEGTPVEESHIGKLPYLQAIIKEAFRIQSTFILPRRAEAQVTIGGFTIPKGAHILINIWALGRDSNVWPNPDLFKPERFMDSEKLYDFGGRNFELIPFGGGRRFCPGFPLASRMLHLMVGSLVHWFDWKLEDGITPHNLNMDEKFGLTAHMAQPLRAVPLLLPCEKGKYLSTDR